MIKNNAGLTDFTNTEIFAVMDLGTNTFHLLIAGVADNETHYLTHDYEAVKLGEGGITKGIIQADAFERGVYAMQRFNGQIIEHRAAKIKAIATSMLRNASNGPDFIDAVKAATGIQIELIDGQQEAQYIYQGVKASGCLSANNSLIIDIGGGSVEFILCTHNQILWKHSFEIGAVRLMERFHTIDPISSEAVTALSNYLDAVLQPLFTAAHNIPIEKLIGSAGAFETFAEVIELEKGKHFDVKKAKGYDFNWQEFINTTDAIIQSSHQQRQQMEGIIPLRVDMIVVASLLTRFVIKKLNIETVGMSTYSLKEGVLAGMIG